MDKIKIYTNETCPYCKQVKEMLTEKGIEFTNINTNEHKEDWQEVVNLTGIATVPTIMFHEEFFVPGRDFGNPTHLINIIENYKNSKYNHTRQTLEKVKTLNYNMGQAFQKLDQLLRQIETKLNIENDG